MGDEQELKTYDVSVTVSYFLTVEAVDEDAAADIAHSEWQGSDYGDVSVDYIEEV